MAKTFYGARAFFVYDGKVVAWANGVSGGEEIRYEEVDVLNNLYPKEYVPIAIRCNLRCAIFRTVGDRPDEGSLKKMGILGFPKRRPSTADPTTGPDHDVYYDDGVVVLIQDRLTKKIIEKFVGVKAASRSFDISARTVAGQNVTFVALAAGGESDEQ